jgi:hypothetical protein
MRETMRWNDEQPEGDVLMVAIVNLSTKCDDTKILSYPNPATVPSEQAKLSNIQFSSHLVYLSWVIISDKKKQNK